MYIYIYTRVLYVSLRVCCVCRVLRCRGGNESRALSLSQGVHREDHTLHDVRPFTRCSQRFTLALRFLGTMIQQSLYVQCGLQANPRRIPVEHTPTFVAHSGP
jgi:hypothetical protein